MTVRSAVVAGWYPGAMRAVAPVSQALAERGWDVRVLTTAFAMPIAAHAGLSMDKTTIVSSEGSDEPFRDYWAGPVPSLLVMGIGEATLTERRLLIDARARRVPSIGILDTWGDYQRRIVEPAMAGAWCDVLSVMNDVVREELAPGYPGRVVAAGQPGLEEFMAIGLDADARRRSKVKLGLPPRGDVVTFFSQPIAEQFGQSLGYTQYDALRGFLAALDGNVTAVVVPHPREDALTLRETIAERGIVVDGGNRAELYAASDVVVSCFSASLIEAVLARRPAVSVQPGMAGPDRCWTNTLGVSEGVFASSQVAAAIGKALRLARDGDELNRRRDAIGVRPGAVARILRLVESLEDTSVMEPMRG